VFLTGLSGAGKSTIAKVLRSKLLEFGGRPVTLLDGDVVGLFYSALEPGYLAVFNRDQRGNVVVEDNELKVERGDGEFVPRRKIDCTGMPGRTAPELDPAINFGVDFGF